MSIGNCARCGRMYQKTPGVKLCPDCIQSEEDAFRTVREYLETNPGAKLTEVSAATEVDEAMIMRFMRQGRLAVLEELLDGLKVDCQRCGKAIAGGRYCASCTEGMGQELKNSAKSLLDRSSPDASLRIRRPETLKEKHKGDSSS